MNASQIADALAQLQDANIEEAIRSQAADLLAASGSPAVPARRFGVAASKITERLNAL